MKNLTSTTSTCNQCNQTKPHADFHNTNTTRGLSYICKVCSRENNKRLRDKPMYSMFVNVISRCDYECHDAYPSYGGRGITYDKQIFSSYVAFSAAFLDEYNRCILKYPNQKLTIERLDNNGNYVQGNVTFVPNSIQQQNKSNSIQVKLHDGTLVNASKVAFDNGLSSEDVARRYNNGWTIELIVEIGNNKPLIKLISANIKKVRHQMKYKMINEHRSK